MLKLKVSRSSNFGQRLLNHTEYVTRYASKEAAEEAGDDNKSDDEMSSAGSYRSDGEEEQPAGEMDDVV